MLTDLIGTDFYDHSNDVDVFATKVGSVAKCIPRHPRTHPLPELRTASCGFRISTPAGAVAGGWDRLAAATAQSSSGSQLRHLFAQPQPHPPQRVGPPDDCGMVGGGSRTDHQRNSHSHFPVIAAASAGSASPLAPPIPRRVDYSFRQQPPP